MVILNCGSCVCAAVYSVLKTSAGEIGHLKASSHGLNFDVRMMHPYRCLYHVKHVIVISPPKSV